MLQVITQHMNLFLLHRFVLHLFCHMAHMAAQPVLQLIRIARIQQDQN